MEPIAEQSAASDAPIWRSGVDDQERIPFLADVVSTDEAVIVRFVGELDTTTLARAEGLASEALSKAKARRFLIDMSEVTFCGSSGLSLLVRLTLSARDSGREAVVVRPRPIVRRMIVVTQLEGLLTIED
jgi:anti-sigma B factor antagonist